MDIKKEILNQLLDKYEKSAHFKGDAKVKRRVSLDLHGPLYDYENPVQKQAVHIVLEELSKKHLVEIQWLHNQVKHIATKVHLVLDNVDKAYKEIKRPQKKLALQQVKELCITQDGDPDWLVAFLSYVTEFIDTRYKFPALLPSTQEEQQNLLTVLRAIARLDGEEVLVRVFSKRLFRDSKYFETHLRSKTASILSRFKLEAKDLTPDQILQEAGLFSSSDELLFTGPISVKVGGSIIDFTPLKYGTAMGARTVRELEIADLKAGTVITIENKASYREYCSQMDDRTLAIYLAGFPGPMKKLFLRKLYDYGQKNRPEIRFLHWSDIDLGGFRIFRNLKDVVPILQPYFMDVETLLKYREQCQPLAKGYRNQLEELMKDQGYQAFYAVVDAMLRENIRLEQESITQTL